MTKKDLEEIGIVHIESKLNPHRFFVPFLGEVSLTEPYDIKDIFLMLYNKGKKDGIYIGEKNKISEIKKILEIEIDD